MAAQPLGLLQWWETSPPSSALSPLLCQAPGSVSSSPCRPSLARVRVQDGEALFPGPREGPCLWPGVGCPWSAWAGRSLSLEQWDQGEVLRMLC